MMLVDSHCHLDHLDSDANEAIHNAWDNEVKHILSVGLTPDQSQKVIEIAEKYPHVSASVGIHPTEEIKKELSLDELISLGNHPKVVAIGETGLDFYRDFNQPLQEERFRMHVRAARKLKKPLIIHTRHARKRTIEILIEENAEEVGGVMHCFTESAEMAEASIHLNFMISFSGIITFKNAIELQELVKTIPLEKILIETDAPYLAPVPYRGKSNVPAYVKYVAAKIAELKNISFEKVAEMTTQNYFELFSLSDRSEYVRSIQG